MSYEVKVDRAAFGCFKDNNVRQDKVTLRNQHLVSFVVFGPVFQAAIWTVDKYIVSSCSGLAQFQCTPQAMTKVY